MIFLVAKVGPLPRSPRDVSNIYAYLLSAQSPLFHADAPSKPDPMTWYQTESDYFAFSNRLLGLETQILYALAFDTHVSLPHPLAITYLQTLDFLGLKDRKQVSLRVVQYLNTALLSPQMLYLTHQPHALATAAIYCAARDVGAKMPECAWWEVFDVDREELGFLVVGLRSVEAVVKKRRDEMAWVWKGMVTRGRVEDGIRQKGGKVENGRDEEDEVMKMMDAR